MSINKVPYVRTYKTVNLMYLLYIKQFIPPKKKKVKLIKISTCNCHVKKSE